MATRLRSPAPQRSISHQARIFVIRQPEKKVFDAFTRQIV